MTATESWIAVVQTGDQEDDQETEVVTITHPNGLPVIEITNGTRITCMRPAVAA